MSLGPFEARWLDQVTSTNDLACDAARTGEPGPLWFVARRQTAGRGRQGRNWASPSGNFHGSLLLRTARPLAEVASLSLIAGLAVAEAVHGLSAGRLTPRLKWPNDLLLGGAKLAGVLLEGGEAPALPPRSPESGAPSALPRRWVVIGIGVNLVDAPAAVAWPTVSLQAAGVDGVTPERFFDALALPLARRIAGFEQAGFAPQREAWLAAAQGLGQEVRLKQGDRERRGRLADLGVDGAILLETGAGRLERFSAGELFFGGGPS